MPRSYALISFFLLTSTPIFAQAPSSDSQTLQALLAEVRQMRHELETTTIGVQRVQILLHRLEMQESSVARASQKVEEARAEVLEAQSNRARMAEDIRRTEDLMSQTEKSDGGINGLQNSVTALRATLSHWDEEEQQRQAKLIEAQDHLQEERSKLAELQQRLDQLDRTLEKSGQAQAALNSR